ncbi:MAG: hypothetical protein RL282_1161 [Bacteroidota bacterium]|jgi:hypothetical protein
MFNRISLALFFFVFISSTVLAQKVKPRLRNLPLSNLEAFQSPGSNWNIVGAAQAGYNDTILNTAKGEGILFNHYNRSIQFQPGRNLMTKMEHGDMVIELDLMIPKGSNSGIYLQSRYEVQVNDSWGVKAPRHGDMGGIYERWKDNKGYEGKPPMKNACLAPGLWQHLEVSFQAPRFDASGKKTADAKFIYVKLNGITLHENIIVSGPTRAAAFEDEKAYGPLMIQGDHGQIAIRNFKYAPQDELKVGLSGLSYQYFEKSAKTPEEAAKTKPTAQGQNVQLDARLASARDKYFIQFEGKLNVPVKDLYTFSMLYTGDGSLEIDGKKVIGPEWTHTGGYPVDGTASLEAGEHRFKLWVNKDVEWARTGLSLYIEKPNSRAVALHSPASMPERAPAPLIAVKAESNPEIIRSFMVHNNKKLTHVLSVGDPSKVHYAYDLLQGSILQIWKGDFLNTTEMWHERGEPQTATPLGAPIVLFGTSPIYDKTLTKDSIADYQYKGYTLSANGHPQFQYAYKNWMLQDQIVPGDNSRGLKRSITVTGEGKDKTMIRIAQAKSITPLGNGLYSMGDQEYFVQLTPGLFPKIENYQGGQVLLMSANEPIQYQLIW